MGEVHEFKLPPKLGKGERPRRDVDRAADLDVQNYQNAARKVNELTDSDLIHFAKSGGPKESA